MPHLPDTQHARRIREMHAAGLLSWRHLQPWATALVAQLDEPPWWVCQLVTLTYQGDIARCIGEHVHSPPFEHSDLAAPSDVHAAALLLRYHRRELSWATFLREAGAATDAEPGREDCEYFYVMLSRLEERDYDERFERRQALLVAARFADAIALVTAEYAPFALALREARGERRPS